MSASLAFAAAVEPEIRDAAAWYESQRVGLGEEFLQALDAAFARVAALPGAGAPWHEYRRVATRRFPYVVFYRVVSAELVQITAVAHMSRRPGYWLDR